MAAKKTDDQIGREYFDKYMTMMQEIDAIQSYSEKTDRYAEVYKYFTGVYKDGFEAGFKQGEEHGKRVNITRIKN